MLADSWKTCRLGALGRIVTGKTPSTKIPEYFGSDVPFVTPSDMDARKVIGTTERCLSSDGVEAVRNAVIPPGAVMVSCIGSDMGKVAVAGRQCVTNQQINSIIVDHPNNPDFVYSRISQVNPCKKVKI